MWENEAGQSLTVGSVNRAELPAQAVWVSLCLGPR